MGGDTSTPDAALPAVLLLVGASMAPTLPLGTRVRIEPLPASAALRAGEVLVLRCLGVAQNALLVHRLLLTFGPGRAWIVHVGDAGGGLGVAPRQAVVGRVLGRLGEPGPLSAPEAEVQARLRRARRRARLYVVLRACARTLGGRRLAALGRRLRDRLLARAGS